MSSYFTERCTAIGFDATTHVLKTKEHKAMPNSELHQFTLLAETVSGGIAIPLYDLQGMPVYFDAANDSNKNKLRAKNKPFEIVRHHPHVHKQMCDNAEKLGQKEPGKYNIPKGAKSMPWIAPNIIDAFSKKEKIHTLILTEGYIKAISGWINGLHIFGLTSITGYKDKDTQTLHPCILEVIKVCEVDNVVILYDGDCGDISLKAISDEKDLYKRPFGFFNSASKINELLKDYRRDRHFDVYWANINTKELEQNNHPKGLDDLFSVLDTNEKALAVKELTHFSKTKNNYFVKFNITINIFKVIEHLHIQTAEVFYRYHNQTILLKQFTYHGTKYQFNEEENGLKIVVPGAAKNYIRVGDDYYEKIYVPNEIGVLEFRLAKRSKSTVTDDHGKGIIEHIQKYKSFFCKPDHLNYQDVIDGCYNSYKPFEHKASTDKDCPTVLSFLNHIFGTQIELGLDYIQLLYQRPTEKLPILSLVSKQQKTGKSTFLDFLKAIFTGNMAMIGNDQLESNFNGSWTDKLIVACEESFIEKKRTVEKIKALSTAKRAEVEKKGVDSSEISFFGKFILNSNNETNFTLADESDTRYWVVKVPTVNESNPNLLTELIFEIDNFLCFLNERHLSVPVKEDRMWFAFWRIKTEAFVQLVEANKSGPLRELTHLLKSTFLDCGFLELNYTLKYIHETLFKGRYTKEYIQKLLNEKLGKTAGTPQRIYCPEIKMINQTNPSTGVTELSEEIVLNKLNGRPYTFHAMEFLTETELIELKISDAALSIGQKKDNSNELVNSEVDRFPF